VVSTVDRDLLAIEYVVIVVQVVRGRPSHFNMSTPLDTALWATMGGTIAALGSAPRSYRPGAAGAVADPASGGRSARWADLGWSARTGRADDHGTAQTVPRSVGGVDRMIARTASLPDAAPAWR